MILLGFKKKINVEEIPLRAKAIEIAAIKSKPNSIILIAGKGHEKYQEIKGEIIPFDDLEVVIETLKIMNK